MAKKRPTGLLYSKDSAIPAPERWLQLSARETKHTDRKTSRYRGVSIYRMKDKLQWRAGLTYNGKRYFLGTFETEDEAAFAWNEAVLRIIGPLAEQRLNVISSPLNHDPH